MVGFVLVLVEIAAAEGDVVGEGCGVSVKMVAACL